MKEIIFDGTKAFTVRRDYNGLHLGVENYADHGYSTHKVVNPPPKEFRPDAIVELTFPKREAMRSILTTLMWYATDDEILDSINDLREHRRTQEKGYYNHSLAVKSLTIVAERLYNENIKLIERLAKADREIYELRQGEFTNLVKQERAKLEKEFEGLRNALTQVILDFPDIDY